MLWAFLCFRLRSSARFVLFDCVCGFVVVVVVCYCCRCWCCRCFCMPFCCQLLYNAYGVGPFVCYYFFVICLYTFLSFCCYSCFLVFNLFRGVGCNGLYSITSFPLTSFDVIKQGNGSFKKKKITWLLNDNLRTTPLTDSLTNRFCFFFLPCRQCNAGLSFSWSMSVTSLVPCGRMSKVTCTSSKAARCSKVTAFWPFHSSPAMTYCPDTPWSLSSGKWEICDRRKIRWGIITKNNNKKTSMIILLSANETHRFS